MDGPNGSLENILTNSDAVKTDGKHVIMEESVFLCIVSDLSFLAGKVQGMEESVKLLQQIVTQREKNQ